MGSLTSCVKLNGGIYQDGDPVYKVEMHYTDTFLTLADGITLHLRDWPTRAEGQVQDVICLHGLTRNAADFDAMAKWLSGQSFKGKSYHIRALTFRGRGLSDHDPAYMNYTPLRYVQDVEAVLAQLALDTALFIGTSLGGIVAMLLAAKAPAKVSALVINDVGPTLAPAGIARIGAYVATPPVVFKSWSDAQTAVHRINGLAFPDASEVFWQQFTRNLCRPGKTGIEFNYDPNIATALAEAGPAPDLWPAFTRISCPLLVIRGELSDLLTQEIIQEMKQEAPHMQEASIPRIGHAPMLDEPASITALASFLSELP